MLFHSCEYYSQNSQTYKKYISGKVVEGMDKLFKNNYYFYVINYLRVYFRNPRADTGKRFLILSWIQLGKIEIFIFF